MQSQAASFSHAFISSQNSAFSIAAFRFTDAMVMHCAALPAIDSWIVKISGAEPPRVPGDLWGRGPVVHARGLPILDSFIDSFIH